MSNGASIPVRWTRPWSSGGAAWRRMRVMKGGAAWLLVGGCIVLLSVSGCDSRPLPFGDLSRWQSPKSSPVSSRPNAARRSSATQAADKNSSDHGSPAGNSGDTRVVSAAIPQLGEGGADPELVGLREQELVNLLGIPNETVSRPPARIWRYSHARCHLNVSFYPDVQTREFRILSYEVTGNDGTDQGKRQCWSQLRTRAKSR